MSVRALLIFLVVIHTTRTTLGLSGKIPKPKNPGGKLINENPNSAPNHVNEPENGRLRLGEKFAEISKSLNRNRTPTVDTVDADSDAGENNRTRDGDDISRLTGIPSVPGEYLPYFVSFQIEGIPVCGGVLITSDIVVTSVWCLYEMSEFGFAKVTVAAGISTMLPYTSAQKRNILFSGQSLKYAAYIHPNYNRDTSASDVAAMRIEPPFDIIDNNDVQPAPLCSEGYQPNAGVPCVIYGMGSLFFRGPTSAFLQQISVLVYNKEQCDVDWLSSKTFVSPEKLCTDHGSNGFEGTCSGDRGSPVVIQDLGCVAAINSFGDLPCGGVNPDVQTPLTDSVTLAWILDPS